MIIVDHFSHWPEFVPLSDIEAPTIAMALIDHWCCQYGIPERRFHSDGANNVHGLVIQELNKFLGISKSKSSRLHPQGDGTSEAFVKQIKSCIQKQVNDHGSDWDLHLQTTAFAIRNNIAHSTKFTLSELMLGTKLSQPIDQFVESPPKSFAKQAIDFAKNVKAKIENSTKIVQQNLQKSRNNMKKEYDKKVKGSPIHVGDYVMLWKPYKRNGLSRCFQPNWDGPWKVDSFTGHYNVKIMRCDNETLLKNVHINQLKPITIRLMAEPKEHSYHINDTNDFNHYLEDLYEEEETHELYTNIDENVEVVNENVVNNELIQQDIINSGWSNINVDNVLPQRTRGVQLNVKEIVPPRYR